MKDWWTDVREDNLSDRVDRAAVETVSDVPLPENMNDWHGHFRKWCERMRRFDPGLSPVSDEVIEAVMNFEIENTPNEGGNDNE